MKGGSQAEMMDTDGGDSPLPLFLDKSDAARDFVAAARRLIDQGKPSQALQAVVMATRAQGGDQAVIQILNRARELYIHRIQETASVDRLASLFAECAIAEAHPSKPDPPPSINFPGANQTVASDAHGASILAETGQSQIMLDAFEDGSSFICLQCGGLVSIHRRDEHYAYWCSNM
ncbi:PREDICTED: uncharacterized protein LOC104807114 [Tarenaya hassleriana]|uniref:uncharacterized protein LOC104807114 n=1 Tax=Tarenaya hassleriana TaxID=28532 RepID=UPI00053CA3DE|nr:PREDICTED: uncharacterized protein LOC104807114 [Tarenaya hassleriana]